MRLDVYSHNVKVSKFDRRGLSVLYEFCRPLTQMGVRPDGRGGFIREKLRVFAAATSDRREFRFHRHQLDDLLRHLSYSGYAETDLHIVHHGDYEPVRVDFTVNKNFILRDYQVPAVEYLTSDGRTKVLAIQTGKGKGLMSMKAMEVLGVRTCVVIKGMYVEKWVEEIEEVLGLKAGDVMVVRGSSSLKTLIQLGLEGQLDAKVIIITIRTLMNYVKSFEKFVDVDMGYGCRPEDFYRILGVGLRIVDEVHQEFHANFKQDLYFHVPKTINLSATLEPDDPFMRRMYEIAFPRSLRYTGIEYDKYIAVKALFYTAEDISKIRYLGKRRSYSHVTFEKSIMRNKTLTKKYLALIEGIVETSYLNVRENGQRMLIFAATIKFCTLLTEHLQKRYPDLDIRRYVMGDPYQNLMEADISVSTIKSAGTAVDIDGLRVTLMTDAMSSRQANEQTVGRLRRLKKWPDVTPEFIYLVCEDIPQHVIYHERKREFLQDKVLSIKEYRLGERL